MQDPREKKLGKRKIYIKIDYLTKIVGVTLILTFYNANNSTFK